MTDGQAATQARAFRTIVLAIENDDLREVMRRMLDGSGYTILAASKPAEVYRISHTHAGTLDLLIADAAMPPISGLELARWMERRHLELKVLFVTGGYFNYGQLTGYALLQKPFDPDMLANKIREILLAP